MKREELLRSEGTEVDEGDLDGDRVGIVQEVEVGIALQPLLKAEDLGGWRREAPRVDGGDHVDGDAVAVDHVVGLDVLTDDQLLVEDWAEVDAQGALEPLLVVGHLGRCGAVGAEQGSCVRHVFIPWVGSSRSEI